MNDRKVEGPGLRVGGQRLETAGASPIHFQPSTIDQPHLSPNQRAWRRFRNHRPAVVSAWFLAVLIAVVIMWPLCLNVAGLMGTRGKTWSQTHNPDQLSDRAFRPPSTRYWFGTDVHGRDVFSRVLYGAQISLLVGAVGAGVSLVIGVLWGSIAGYVGGRTDSAMMRFVDILYSLPSIIFVIVIFTVFETALKTRLNGFQAFLEKAFNTTFDTPLAA